MSTTASRAPGTCRTTARRAPVPRDGALPPADSGVTAGTALDASWRSDAFAPISLDQLNARAAMLKRSDNKYIVRAPILRRAVPLLAPDFDILEIDGARAFSYETCYFDDAARSSYRAHHQGRRQRCKVRMRRYVDAGLCFVEVKLKDKRGATLKRRLACALEQFGHLDATALDFVCRSWRELYDSDFTASLAPAVRMRYRRMTLVARQGGERMTLDFDLTFAGQGRTMAVAPGLYLLETKSAKANGIADKVLRTLHQHPTRPCSKYCIALAALQEVPRYNRFLPALRQLGIVPPGSHRRPAPRVQPATRVGTLAWAAIAPC